MALHILGGRKLTTVHKWEKRSPTKGADKGDDDRTGKIVDSWKNKIAILESNFNESLTESTSECKIILRKLSFDLLNYLTNLENQLERDKPQTEQERDRYIGKWRNAIKNWKSKVVGIKCHQKEHLSNLIRKHCDFLMNINQFHPEFIKWKISSLILETNKIILANDDEIRKTEGSLFNRLASLFEDVDDKFLDDKLLEEPDGQEHDVINVHYDELELEEELKRRGDLLIEQIDDLRTDNTLTSLVEWLSKLRIAYTEPICSFKNYDPTNLRLDSAVDHLELCKTTITGIAISFLDLVEPVIREELMATKPQHAYELSYKRRCEIERWLECVSFFEFTTNNTLKLVKIANQIWNQHVCRLETVKQLVVDNIRTLLIKQNQQQMKIEQKINTLLDIIRESTSREEINYNVQSVEKLYKELIKIYHKTYETGLEEADEFSTGSKNAKTLFLAQAALYVLNAADPSEFPQHGSETDVTLDPMTDLQHWEIIKQLFQSNGNWYLGLIEGMSLLCKVENEEFDELYLKGLKRQLAWINELKEEAIEQRKERLQTELVIPRTLELQEHENTLLNHSKGLNKVFADRSDWEDEFRCNLLFMADKLFQENEAILNYTNYEGNYHSYRFLGRISNFENDVKNIESCKNTLLESTLLRIEKKFLWLKKANCGMLKYISLFSEGGNFNPKEAMEFSDEINKLQTLIISEEKSVVEAIRLIAETIDPLKNINVEPLSKIKALINYKIKKTSVEDTAHIIIDNLAKKIEGEIHSAKDVCSEICDLINCNLDQEKIIQCLAGFASYLMYPHQESSVLECEDKEYIEDFMTSASINKLDYYHQHIKEDQECQKSRENEIIPKTCSELMDAAGYSFPRQEDRRRSKMDKLGVWKKGSRKLSIMKGMRVGGHDDEDRSRTGKKGGDRVQGLNKQKRSGSMCVERKDVLRDTICEQLKRIKAIKVQKEMEEKNPPKGREYESKIQNVQGQQSSIAEVKIKYPAKKSIVKKKKASIASKTKETIEKKENIPNFILTVGDEMIMKPEEEEAEEEEETIAPAIIEGDYLYKYTRLPKERIVCTFLLHTKRIIYEHYLKIQNIAERFFVTSFSKVKKKHIPKEISLKKDFKTFTSQTLKKLRILNIQSEHAWIIVAHDFVCLLRAFQNLIDKRLEKNFVTFENKWKHEFCRILTTSDDTLSNIVVMKNRKAEELICNSQVIGFEETNFEEVLTQLIQSHCDGHITEIKHIWSQFSTELTLKYLDFKDEVSKFVGHAKAMRNILKDNKTIYSFVNILKNISLRFQKNVKDVIETDTSSWSNAFNPKLFEINKLKSLHVLFKIVFAMLQDLETVNSLKTPVNVSSEVLLLQEMTNPEKVNLQQKTNHFSKNIVRYIKRQHGAFKKICSDQIIITAKWHHHWQCETQKIKESETENIKEGEIENIKL